MQTGQRVHQGPLIPCLPTPEVCGSLLGFLKANGSLLQIGSYRHSGDKQQHVCVETWLQTCPSSTVQLMQRYRDSN